MGTQGTILLADDEETFAKATQNLLQREGYDCHTVGNAHELSEALHQGTTYDLLITDLNMPGNRVMEMVDEIRQFTQLLPVIIITGYPSIATAMDSVRFNVLEYLVKPVEFPHLLKSVREGIAFKRELTSARSVGEMARQRLDELERIEKALVALGRRSGPRKTADMEAAPSLADLVALQLQQNMEILKANQSKFTDSIEAAQLAVVSDNLRLREGIFDAIHVLQLTKGRFRSKELADLRLKLQEVLNKTTPTPKGTHPGSVEKSS